MYEYNLDLSDSAGNCTVSADRQLKIKATIQNDTASNALIDSYYFYIKNSLNYDIKRFRYYRYNTTEFVLEPNKVYDLYSLGFTLPPGVYHIETSYIQSNFVPAGKYFAVNGMDLVEG